MKKRPLSLVGQRRVRMGRKVIACGRIVERLESNMKKPRSSSVLSMMSHLPWRRIGVIASIAVVLTGAGFGGYSVYRAQQQTRADEQAKVQFEIEKAARQKRAACEAEIAKNSADKLGKVTYDQLYGNTCDQ